MTILCSYGSHISKAPFIWRKRVSARDVPDRRVTRLPKLPWASQLFCLTLNWQIVDVRNNTLARARSVALLAGSGALLARPTFLHINILSRPAKTTRSRHDNQSIATLKGRDFISCSIERVAKVVISVSKRTKNGYRRILWKGRCKRDAVF